MRIWTRQQLQCRFCVCQNTRNDAKETGHSKLHPSCDLLSPKAIFFPFTQFHFSRFETHARDNENKFPKLLSIYIMLKFEIAAQFERISWKNRLALNGNHCKICPKPPELVCVEVYILKEDLSCIFTQDEHKERRCLYIQVSRCKIGRAQVCLNFVECQRSGTPEVVIKYLMPGASIVAPVWRPYELKWKPNLV